MPKPIAVLISDVHYSVQTLELADKAMRMAINKANDLHVPLVVAGDLHDTKANMRGECVKALRATFKTFNVVDIDPLYEGDPTSKPYILRGNHDAFNEKSTDHSLECLEDLAHIVGHPGFYNELHTINGNSIHLIPYHHDPEELRKYLKKVDKGSCIIMHQGIEGSNAGDYIQDKSAINHEDVKDFRVISGHYHQRQDIKTGRPQKGAVGLWSYIGNPYSLNYAEANDPPKGFQILMDDGTLEFVPTNLRKHVIVEIQVDKPYVGYNIIDPFNLDRDKDFLWVKVSGSKEKLMEWDKQKVIKLLKLRSDFRLDLIPTDTITTAPENAQNMTQMEILDNIIGSLSDTSEERKERLKELWKGMQ